MSRFVVLLAAITIGSAAYAQSAPHSPTKHHKSTPAAQTAEDPNDVTKVPQNVQKWIGGAMDDILTGASKTIDETTKP